MSSSLASLVVDMQVNAAGMRKGLAEANASLKGFAAQVKTISDAVTAFASLTAVQFGKQLVTGIADFVAHGAEAADQLGKMAQAAGVSTESFSRLSYAAGLSSVSNEELGTALKKLNGNIAEAAAGSTKQAALFSALGVSVKDASGNMRSADDVMASLAGAFAGMQDGAAKSAFAVELFGKAGSQLIPFLNEGDAGLKRLGDEADRFGLTVSSGAARAAEEFNDNLDRMKRAVDGVAIRVAADLAPAFADLTGQLIHSKTAADGFSDTAEIIATALRGVATLASFVVREFRMVGSGIAGVAAVAAAAMSGDVNGAIEAATAALDEFYKINKDFDDQFDAIWKKTEKAMTLPEMDFRKTGDELYKGFKHAAEGAHELNALLRDMIAAKRELDKIARDAQMKFASKAGEISSAGAADKQSFGEIGKEASAILKAATAGFLNFNEALNTEVNDLIDAQEKLRDATVAESQGAFEQAAQFRAQAAVLEEGAAHAKRAKEAFKKIAEQAAADANTLGGAMKAFAGSVLQAIPRLNELVSAAQQGAQVGGVWGALIAVIVQLMSKTEGFSRIIDVVNKDLDAVIGILGPLVDGIASLIEAFTPITDSLLATLKGPLETIGGLFKAIAPILSAIMAPLKDVGTMVSGLGSFMKTGAQPIFIVLKLIGTVLKVIAPILQLLMLPLTLLGVLFEELSKALAPVFKDIDTAFSWLANRLDEFGAFVGSLGERIKNQIEHGEFKTDAERAAKTANMADGADTRAVSQAGEGLISNATRDTADAVTGLGDAAGGAAKSIAKLSESFTNLPQGFKVRLAGFESMDGLGRGGSLSDRGRGNAPATTINVTVMGSLLTELDLAALIERLRAKQGFRRRGVAY